MNGSVKILAHIKAKAKVECDTIARDAAAECEQIRADYSRLEQDEYWKHINVGSKEAEHRSEQLKSLAAMESKKLLLATQQEMVDEAFALAAKKLQELPKREYSKLLATLNLDTPCDAKTLVERYRKELSLKIVSLLFD